MAGLEKTARPNVTASTMSCVTRQTDYVWAGNVIGATQVCHFVSNVSSVLFILITVNVLKWFNILIL